MLTFALSALLAVAMLPATTVTASEAPELAREILRARAMTRGLSSTLSDLMVSRVAKSKAATHVTFQQIVRDVPLFGATITVNMGQAGTQILNRYQQDPAVVGGASPHLGKQQAATVARRRVRDGEVVGDPDLILWPDDGVFRPAWHVGVRSRTGPDYWLFVVDAATGDILARGDQLQHDSGAVFDNNPYDAGYAGSSTDCDLSPSAADLSSFRVNRHLPGLEVGYVQLVGEYADLRAPGIQDAYKPAGQASESSRAYDYGCDDDRFEEVNAYYHIDYAQRVIQGLGYIPADGSGIYARPIPVHAHYCDESNAFYSRLNRGLHFCDGTAAYPTDLAEDGDVILHEYGHALMDDQQRGICPNGDTFGECEGRALGEGFGDLLAALITGEPCIAEWTDPGESACAGSRGLRTAENVAVYPQDWVDEPHADGQIWSGAVWDIAQQLGGSDPTPEVRERVLDLLLDSHWYIDQFPTFNNAAVAFIQANRDLYDGANEEMIASAFDARGISPLDEIPPEADMAALSLYRTVRTIPLSWEGSDSASGVAFDVRHRKGKYSSATFSSYSMYRTGTTSKAAAFTGSPGYLHCFSVRALDGQGNASDWTEDECTTVPVNDRALSMSGPWSRGAGSGYYLDTYSSTKTLGASLSLGSVKANELLLVATKCVGCGTVDVYLGSTRLKRLSLTSSTTKKKQLIRIASFSNLRSGTVRIKVVSSEKRVIIEGLAVA